jgi:hypothetical protein
MPNVRNGKGAKDRTTVLPICLQPGLQARLIRIAQLHADDRNRGAGLAPLPNALERKYPNASESLAWQFVFPLPYVDLGGKVGVLPVGMYRPRRSNAHSVRLWFAREL